MKPYKKIFSCTNVLWISLLSLSLHAQIDSDTLKYDILIDDKVIGDLIAIKDLKSDSSFEYSVLSNVDYKILFSFHISFDYKTVFNRNGKYSSSTFEYIMNDDIKESNWINCNSEECYVYEGDEIIKVIDNSVKFTAIQLYFKEPLNGLSVFSERFCDMFEVEKEKGGYKVDFPGGSTNTYYYRNGICYRVLIETLISDMEIKVRDYEDLLTEK